MALVFVRLRARLLVAALGRAGIAGTVAISFAVVLAIAIGVFAGVLIALIGAVPESDRASATSAALGFIFIGWVLGPLMTAGADEGIPLAPLAQFPLRRAQRISGLLAAACISFGGIVTVAALAGFVLAWSVDLPTTLVAVVAAALFALVCIAASRLAVAAVSLALRRKRWRGIVTALVPMLGFGFVIATQVFARSGATSTVGGRDLLGRLDSVTRFLPSTLLSGAVGDFSAGKVGSSAVQLAAAVGVIAVIVLTWDHLVERILTRSSDPVAGREKWRPLFRGALLLLPRNTTGAVAAKELRLTWRDPRRRMALIGGFIGALAPVTGLVVSSTSPRLMLLAGAASSMLIAQQTNQFGFDGRSLWVNVATGADVESDLRGRQLSIAAVAAGVFAAAAALLAARSSSTAYLLVALAMALAVGGAALGMASYISATFPVPVPDDATNPLSLGGPGRKVAAIGPAFVVLGICAVIAAPFVIAAMTSSRHPLVDGAIVLAGAVVGFVGWKLGTDAAVRSVTAGLPELLEQLDPRAS